MFFSVYFVQSAIIIIALSLNGYQSKAEELSLENSIVYGPGLKADFVVPVRYFFIQLVDKNGKNFTSSPSGQLSAQVRGSKEACQVWMQLLNVRDGSFIVRYRLYRTCSGLHIEVKYNEKHIADSPYIVEGDVYHEHCYCPKSFLDWSASLECPDSHPQIKDDLQPFKEIDMNAVLKQALKRFNNPGAYSICHYSVVSNEIYRKCYGQYVGFNMFMDSILLSLTRKVILPDVEFIINLGDWPLEETSKNPLPILSWCGSKGSKDIVMPTYDITESTLEMMGRVMLDILAIYGNCEDPWENKTEVAFWRGRDSRQERLDLITLSRRYPDLINASLTNFFFFRDVEEKYGPKVKPVSFFYFFKYKYQINVDGTVAAYRFPYLLAGDSVVLKQDSDYYEHFYNMLTPMVHYIPFKRDLSDLVEKLKWAKEHDEEARTIAQNARHFTRDNLLPHNIFCYYALLLKEYSKLLKNKVEVHSGMEHVPQPKDKPTCECKDNQIPVGQLRRKEEL
ncbi:KDEL motif-containing protein 1-like isoform X2 [Centruroides sculpturatus]|nr:KDEL motif-containing protein 1-like isoform X2 [Centruroides sculpturatus]XP_023225986.1 KDEL motif-containing protein 1-like isoform X2 [Centruroides sculpturatus]XP_023225996.1 KDEL motif-containing protein 1-like isoform X2 [Centruroides sculpturatus]XP_023226002.1 KDEL motif-containing protein 1-like isoform X2 [Centruroides sculpturatus]